MITESLHLWNWVSLRCLVHHARIQTQAFSEQTLTIMKYCKYDLNCRTVRILLWRRWGRLQTLTSSNWDRVKRNKCVCNNTTYNILFLIPRCTADLWYHKGIFCYLYFLNPQCIIVLHPTIKSTGCDIQFILFCSVYFLLINALLIFWKRYHNFIFCIIYYT